MRVQVLGTVKSVIDREFTRKNGEKGIAHGVMFNVNGEDLQGELFNNGEEWQKMGCQVGAIGTMTIWLTSKPKQTQDGRNYISNEWKFMEFRLANQNIAAPSAPGEQAPAAPAQVAEAAEVDPDANTF